MEFKWLALVLITIMIGFYASLISENLHTETELETCTKALKNCYSYVGKDKEECRTDALMVCQKILKENTND